MAVVSRPSIDSAVARAHAQLALARPIGLKEKHAAAAAAAAEHAKQLVPYSAASKPRTVQALVEMCCAFIASVWAPREYRLPLKGFVHEVLRRSRVQYPVFQVALCYIMQLKPLVEAHRAAGTLPAGLSCGRRVFVAALQVASKYLQDRSYSVRSWAKISGLEAADLKQNELALLCALRWEMHVPYEAYLRCCRRLRMTIDRSLAPEPAPQPETAAYATPEASPDTLVLSPPNGLATPKMAPSPHVDVWQP